MKLGVQVVHASERKGHGEMMLECDQGKEGLTTWNYFRAAFIRRWTKSTAQMVNTNVGSPMVSGMGT